MKIFRFLLTTFSTLLVLVIGCIEEYPPPVVSDEIDYLVVDGTLNSLTGSATIKLSKAIPLSSTEQPTKVLDAQLNIEDSDGNIYDLEEQSGEYTVTNVPIDMNRRYRLNINRSDGRQYQSAFISIKQTPDIDDVSWRETPERDGIQILVNTHDDTKEARYYQWTYEETFEYVSVYNSQYKYENSAVVPIPPEESVYRCWQTLPSQKIIIGTSENLNLDVISDYPVQLIPAGSQKIIIKYSINVKQRSLNQEAYQYWSNLQLTTEKLGGLFDPQPGSVTGNIFNVNNPNEPILGFFDVGEVKEKRLFINSSELPPDLRSFLPFGNCELDSVSVADARTVADFGYAYVSAIQPMLVIIGYTYSTRQCTDCSLQGGKTTRPAFWE